MKDWRANNKINKANLCSTIMWWGNQFISEILDDITNGVLLGNHHIYLRSWLYILSEAWNLDRFHRFSMILFSALFHIFPSVISFLSMSFSTLFYFYHNILNALYFRNIVIVNFLIKSLLSFVSYGIRRKIDGNQSGHW